MFNRVFILSERIVRGGGGGCSEATPTEDSESAMHSFLHQLIVCVGRTRKGNTKIRVCQFILYTHTHTHDVHYQDLLCKASKGPLTDRTESVFQD